MTPDLPPDDELASAWIDQDTTPQESARVQDSPAIAARAQQFRAIAAQVAEPVPGLPPEQVDTLVATALAADADASAPVTPVDAVAARRAQRGGSPRRAVWLPPPAVAAAVVIVLAVTGLVLLLQGDNDESAQKFDKVGAEIPAAEGGDASAADAPAATEADGADTTLAAADQETAGSAEAAPYPVPDLGSHPDQASLTRVLASVDLVTLAPDTEFQSAARRLDPVDPLAVDRCDEVVRAVHDEGIGDRLGVATAQLAGREMLVYSYPVLGELDANGHGGGSTTVTTAPPTTVAGEPLTLITVVDRESCAIAFGVQR